MSAFTRLKNTVKDARRDAERSARAAGREVGSPFIRSRGTFLCTAAFNGDQCAPRPEAEAAVWEGTLAEIEHLIDDVRRDHPHVAEIYIAGGFDSAETLSDFEGGNYEPWVESWKVTAWKRDASGAIIEGEIK